MPFVAVDASNLPPAKHHVTVVTVTGQGFKVSATANIVLHLEDGGWGVIGQKRVSVLSNGSFEYHFLVSPQLDCMKPDRIKAVVTIVGNNPNPGDQVEATGDVFCPPDLPPRI